ncbi:MAG: flagellar basal body-associated protein FliL [Thiobacillaceae bacterium]
MSKPEKAKVEAIPDEKVAKKSSKKFIILAGVLVALLSAGGAGAWFILGGKGKEAHQEAPPPAPPPVFVNLEPFTVNLQPENGEQYLQVTMVLQVKDDEAAEHIKQRMPQVRSRLLTLLSSKKASEINSGDGKHKLADEIVAQIRQPFAQGTAQQDISGVFFTDLVIQ